MVLTAASEPGRVQGASLGGGVRNVGRNDRSGAPCSGRSFSAAWGGPRGGPDAHVTPGSRPRFPVLRLPRGLLGGRGLSCGDREHALLGLFAQSLQTSVLTLNQGNNRPFPRLAHRHPQPASREPGPPSGEGIRGAGEKGAPPSASAAHGWAPRLLLPRPNPVLPRVGAPLSQPPRRPMWALNKVSEGGRRPHRDSEPRFPPLVFPVGRGDTAPPPGSDTAGPSAPA